MVVPRRQKKLNRIAQAVNYSVDFGIQTAARTAYRFVYRPFFVAIGALMYFRASRVQ